MVEERPLNLGKGWLEKRDERGPFSFVRTYEQPKMAATFDPRPNELTLAPALRSALQQISSFLFLSSFFSQPGSSFTSEKFPLRRQVNTNSLFDSTFPNFLSFHHSFFFRPLFLERNEGRQSERRVDVMRPRLQVEFHFGILPTFANSAKRAFRKRAIDRLGNASQPEAG